MAFSSTIADLTRLQEIIRVFSLAGFGDIFKQMGLEDAAELTGKFMGWKYADELAHLERPRRVCRVFEILGPTFVKLGQVLATRPDLFGPEWITEFEKLQTQAPPLDFEELRRQIEVDLGAPLKEIFEEVDATTIAAASVAQDLRTEPSSHRCSRNGSQAHCPNRGERGAQNDHHGWAVPRRSAPRELFHIAG